MNSRMRKLSSKVSDADVCIDAEKVPTSIGEVPHEGVASVSSPPLNAHAIFSVLVAYTTILTFGVDCQAWGMFSEHEDFVESVCVGNGWGNKIECGLDKAACEIWAGNGSGSKDLCQGMNADQCCNAVRMDLSQWGGVGGITNMFQFYLILGAILAVTTLAPYISDRWGRVMSMRVGSVIVLVGSLVQGFLSFGNYPVMSIGRVILGYGAGLSMYSVPLYGSEIANAKHRARVTGLFQMCTVFAQFFCAVLIYCVGTKLPWKVIQLMPGMLSPLTFVMSFFIARSPRWVMEKYGFDRGYEVLKSVRAEDPSREAFLAWKKLEEDQNVETITYKEAFTLPNIRTRAWTVVFINAFQQFSGVNVLINLSGNIWTQLGMGGSSDTAGLVQSSVFLVSVIAGYLALDTIGGRRIQYLIGTAMLIIASIMIAVGTSFDSRGGDWTVLLGSLVIFGIGFQISHGLIAWLYPAEVFTLREKKTVGNVGSVAQWIAQIIFIFCTSFFSKHLELAGAIFTVTNSIFLVFAWFFVEETKGVPLEDAEKLFEHTPKNHLCKY